MAIQGQANMTSKGQVTLPIEIRRLLGVKAGDRLLFESKGSNIHVTSLRSESRFEKYRGIGNPGIGSGRKAIARWLRDLRGE